MLLAVPLLLPSLPQYRVNEHHSSTRCCLTILQDAEALIDFIAHIWLCVLSGVLSEGLCCEKYTFLFWAYCNIGIYFVFIVALACVYLTLLQHWNLLSLHIALACIYNTCMYTYWNLLSQLLQHNELSGQHECCGSGYQIAPTIEHISTHTAQIPRTQRQFEHNKPSGQHGSVQG